MYAHTHKHTMSTYSRVTYTQLEYDTKKRMPSKVGNGTSYSFFFSLKFK